MALTLKKSLEQAACTALADYLQAQFDAVFTGPEACVVSDQWPAPDSGLPKRAVSILCAGPRQDMNVQEQDIRSTPIAGNLRLYTWRVACCSQPLQLDVWATSAAARDDVVARLTDYLRKGPRFTLGLPNADVTRDGVLLALDPAKSDFQGFADFQFDGPKRMDTSDSTRKREFRSSIMGSVDVDLTTQAATGTLALVNLLIALDPTLNAPTAPDFTLALNTTTGAVAVTGP